jgi:hypothetical protein
LLIPVKFVPKAIDEKAFIAGVPLVEFGENAFELKEFVVVRADVPFDSIGRLTICRPKRKVEAMIRSLIKKLPNITRVTGRWPILRDLRSADRLTGEM